MVGKAAVLIFAQHNMVKHGDAEELAALFEASSKNTLFWARSRITAGMVVR